MPLVPDPGVPASVAVPFPLSVKVTPLGNVAPVSLNAGAGSPEVVTVNEPCAPMPKVALLALVICGAESTTNVKDCVAFGVVPFWAVIVIG